ncbi:MAG: hypothetical protein CM15mP128_1880 [Methanobacteriota archaeon]|nr:MAG: hypothetical protein CM15mP128_1880 [Euryarchaeota archaeon]
MAAQDTLFSVLYDKFLFWAIIVGVLTFGVMFLFMARFRAGLTPDESKTLWKIEPGTFPLESSNHDTDRKLEIAFYVIPTILVAWLTFLATASTADVWGSIPDDENRFDITVNGYQWYWEFVYEDPLTWEDEHTGMDVEVRTSESDVVLHAMDPQPAHRRGQHGQHEDGTRLQRQRHDHRRGLLLRRRPPLQKLKSRRESTVLHVGAHRGPHLPYASGPLIVSVLHGGLLRKRLGHARRRCGLHVHSRPIDGSDPRYVGVQHSFWLPEFGVKETLSPALSKAPRCTSSLTTPAPSPSAVQYCEPATPRWWARSEGRGRRARPVMPMLASRRPTLEVRPDAHTRRCHAPLLYFSRAALHAQFGHARWHRQRR